MIGHPARVEWQGRGSDGDPLSESGQPRVALHVASLMDVGGRGTGRAGQGGQVSVVIRFSQEGQLKRQRAEVGARAVR